MLLALLCASSAVYSLISYRFELPQRLQINGFALIYSIGFSSYSVYLRCLAANYDLSYMKSYSLFRKLVDLISVTYVLILMFGLFSGASVLTVEKSENHTNLFLAQASSYLDQTNISKALIGLGTVLVVTMTIKLMSFFLKHYRSEKLIILGQAVTLLVVLNDILIGANASIYILPLSFLGFGFECIRFTQRAIVNSFQEARMWKERFYEIARNVETTFALRSLLHDLRNLGSKLAEVSIAETEARILDLVRTYEKLTKYSEAYVSMNISSLLRRSRDLIEIENPGVKMQVQIENPESKKLLGHVDLTTLVFKNLISNSVDALKEKGGEELKLRVSLSARPDNKVEVIFSDRTNSISLMNRERLFEPGFTTKQDGRGWGLPLVRDILNVMGGSIHLSLHESSTVDFIIVLPEARA